MPFNEDGSFTKVEVSHPVEGLSKTKQAEKEMVDINNIIRKYMVQGVSPIVNGRMPVYGDFTNSGSYYDCYNRVLDAQAAFDRLPSKVRALCDNDPGKFLEMVQDEGQLELLAKAGLVEEAKPPFVKEEVPVEPVEPVEG